jgi:hypothetical protein
MPIAHAERSAPSFRKANSTTTVWPACGRGGTRRTPDSWRTPRRACRQLKSKGPRSVAANKYNSGMSRSTAHSQMIAVTIA